MLILKRNDPKSAAEPIVQPTSTLKLSCLTISRTQNETLGYGFILYPLLLLISFSSWTFPPLLFTWPWCHICYTPINLLSYFLGGAHDFAITFDGNLRFDKHYLDLCNRASGISEYLLPASSDFDVFNLSQHFSISSIQSKVWCWESIQPLQLREVSP